MLLELNAVPDGLRMQDLALRTVVSRTRVSRIVSELEERGLVDRAIDPSDGRASVVTITGAGRVELRRPLPSTLPASTHTSTAISLARSESAVTGALQRVVDAHAEQADPRR